MRPLQTFEMRAQLLTGTDAKTVKAVILSGINLQITTTPSTFDGGIYVARCMDFILPIAGG